MTTPLIAFASATAAIVGAVAALTDHRTGRIPNTLTLPTTAVGLVMHGLIGGVRAGIVSTLGLIVGLVVPAVLYKVSSGKAIGGGDVKLFAALGALLGPTLIIATQFGSFVLLAAFALIRLTFRGVLLRVLGNSMMLLLNPFLPRKLRCEIQPEAMTEMRLGPAIAIAVLSSLVVQRYGRMFPWI